MTQPPIPSDSPAPAPPAGAHPRHKLIVAAAVLLLVVVAGAVAWMAFGRSGGAGTPPDTDETRLTRLTADFALAVERADQVRVLSLMCAEEAEEVKDGEGYDPSFDGAADTSVTAAPVTLADVVVTGDTAQGTVARPGQDPNTLYFRKEKGTWTVCAPAGDQVTPSASAS
ncbi:hypothetical protein ACLQ26_24305 [Micromonospora sp. DT43]|uniref:Rv0361 family membrane protein n=1 Tax=Micromonospora sp. DT43 TaxID=3393440 RepID=UPI003CF478C2